MSRRSTGLRCPVCGARFRRTVVCSRCGADLEPMMHVALKAWRLRHHAAAAFISGDTTTAVESVQRAQTLHDTPQGRKLDALIRLLDAAFSFSTNNY